MKAKIIIDKDFIVGKTDEKLFGSFVEPIGRCIYGGIFEPGHPKADAQGFREDVLEFTRPLNLSINRYPGGNYTSTYRWEDTVGPLSQRPRRAEPAWQCIETNAFGLNEFVDWSKKNGSDIMMTVNLATRGVLEAMDCVEYCNFAGDTYWSDLRKSHGYIEPHAIKYWCLTNEIDGPWQVGQTNGDVYGRLAREASKGMKLIDHTIKTVLAGSSNPNMPHFPAFDAAALDEAYDTIDYISVHHYIGNQKGDTKRFLAKSVATDRFLKDVAGVCDYIKVKHRSQKTVNISFDEFNVWHTVTEEERFEKRWRIAPPLLEDVYTFQDSLVLGCMFMAVLKHCDRVEIACVSELVNTISHIRTRNGGGVWALPPYYVWLHYAQYGRGTVMNTQISAPTYDCNDLGDVPFVDAIAILNDNEEITLFAVNRSMEEDAEISFALQGFEAYKVIDQILFDSDDPLATNTEQDPHHVVPRPGQGAQWEGGVVHAVLPKLSWNVIRLGKA